MNAYPRLCAKGGQPYIYVRGKARNKSAIYNTQASSYVRPIEQRGIGAGSPRRIPALSPHTPRSARGLAPILEARLRSFGATLYSRVVQTFPSQEPNIWFRLTHRNQI